jgi:hypothetical protein
MAHDDETYDTEITEKLLDNIERYLNMPRMIPVIEVGQVELMGEFDLTEEQALEVRRRLRIRRGGGSHGDDLAGLQRPD